MLRLIKLIIWIAIISGGIFIWQYSSFKSTILTHKESIVTVEPGANFRSVLMDAGANKLYTKIYLQNNAPDFELQAGSYNMPANADIETYIQNLQGAISNDIFVRVFEGWNIFDIDVCLSNPESTIIFNSKMQRYEGCMFDNNGPLKTPLIEKGEFISYAENFCNPELYPTSVDGSACDIKPIFAFLSDAESLEGFLYPDTYAINPNTFNVKSLAVKMLHNFNTKVIKSGIVKDMGSIEILDLVNLASIVEKEEKNPSEKSTVAGILKKRLNENWMIGADITVCYAHRLTAEECKLSVTKYLYNKNDYNTRQKVGLPAGPIGNPSAETIEATLNHTSSPYYYYLHDITTGKIYYGKTEAEHNRNKQLYIR